MTFRKSARPWRLALLAGAGALWFAAAQAQDQDDSAYDDEYAQEDEDAGDEDTGNVSADDVFSDEDDSDQDPDANVYTPDPDDEQEAPSDPTLDLLSPSLQLSRPTSGAPDSTDAAAQGVAVLRGLEKVTGRVREIDAMVGTPVQFGRLEITVRSCRSRPPEETPETTAYLDIDDHKLDGSVDRIFSGWMFASSPALNPLQHPVYDVWVMSCKARAPQASESSR